VFLSSSQINLVGFLYKIYSFIGSDKTILLLDDPVSSLDLMNHYKIAYEIVKNSKTKTKTLIVLTHSTEFINAINSQHPSNSQNPLFEYYYLEQANGIISIQSIPIISNNNPNIISLDKLTDTREFDGFIGALQSKDEDPTNNDVQQLFHYSDSAIHLNGDVTKFSNHDFILLIDKFSCFNQKDFYHDSYLKILYLCALRIWLEKNYTH